MIDSPLNLQDCSDKKKQSLFKLPAIFALFMVMTSILICVIPVMLDKKLDLNGYYANLKLYIFSETIFSYILNSSLYFFLLSIIMFIQQNMHKVKLKNVLIIIGCCIIVQILRQHEEKIYYILIDYTFPSLLIGLTILKSLIIVGLIAIIFSIFHKERQPYLLTFTPHRNLFAFLFAILFCSPTIMLMDVTNWYINTYFHYPINKLPSQYVIALSSIPSVITLLIILINLVLVFAITRGCFNLKIDKIPLKLLFKSTGFAYLYLICFGIVFGIFCSLINITYLVILDPYQPSSRGIIFITTIFAFIFCVIWTIKLIRKAVFRFFGEQPFEW